MPFLAAIPLATIAAIGSAAVGATELGMNLAGVGQPSQGDQMKQLQQQQQAQALADQQAKQRAIQASLPNAQEQGGGALNQPSLLNLGSVIAGLPGEANTPAGQSALTAFLGLQGGGGTGTTSTGTGTGTNLVGATYGLSGSQEG